MNYIIYFFIIILGYLTLAKSTNENFFPINTIHDLENLPEANLHPPSTIILISIKSHGTFLQSHYFRLKLVSAFYSSKIIYVKVPKLLADKYFSSIGMSIYNFSNRTKDQNVNKVSIPGMFFVGNSQLGRWINILNEEKWSFYKAYQHLPIDLGWEEFRPKIEDYKQYFSSKNIMQESNRMHTQLFGINGQLTKKFLLKQMSENKNNDNKTNLNLLKSYFNYKH